MRLHRHHAAVPYRQADRPSVVIGPPSLMKLIGGQLGAGELRGLIPRDRDDGEAPDALQGLRALADQIQAGTYSLACAASRSRARTERANPWRSRPRSP